MANATEQSKTVLAYASLLEIAVWQAIRAERKAGDITNLEELEESIKSGKASLGVYIQRTGGRLYLSAISMPAVALDPFEGEKRFVVSGPVVISAEQLAALVSIDPTALN